MQPVQCVGSAPKIFGPVLVLFKMLTLWEQLELLEVVTSSVVIQLLPENLITCLHKGDKAIKDYSVIQQGIRSIRNYEL